MMARIPSYDDKLRYIKLVAERGAEARHVAVAAGDNRRSRRRARAIFEAMGRQKTVTDSFFGDSLITVLADTPEDGGGGSVSKAWARHVRKVFVRSFTAGRSVPWPDGVPVVASSRGR